MKTQLTRGCVSKALINQNLQVSINGKIKSGKVLDTSSNTMVLVMVGTKEIWLHYTKIFN